MKTKIDSIAKYLVSSHCSYTALCRGLTWQAAQHHAAIRAIPAVGWGRELEKGKTRGVEIRTVQ